MTVLLLRHLQPGVEPMAIQLDETQVYVDNVQWAHIANNHLVMKCNPQYTRAIAEKLALHGFVPKMPDGTNHIVAIQMEPNLHVIER